MIMAVCSSDSVLYLRTALQSLYSQSERNFEIILVSDGYLSPEQMTLIQSYEALKVLPKLKFFQLSQKSGPAQCWNKGIEHASGNYIVRMDPDDIARPTFVEQQVGFLRDNLDVDICGSFIEEFNNTPGDLKRFRKVPLSHKDIVSHMRFKNTMNHVTVCFRRDKIADKRYEQIDGFVDYLFWLKLRHAGLRFQNRPEVTVDVRVGHGFLLRRGGASYAAKELKFANYCMHKNYFGRGEWFSYVVLKIPFRLLPRTLLNMVYKLIRH